MSYKISKHAHQEIDRRGLSLPEIQSVLAAPEQVVAVRDGLKCFQSKISQADGGVHLLRVIINPLKDPKLVVTAYKTSKVSKYWEE